MKYIVISAIVFLSFSLAICQEPVRVEEGDKAPFSGWIVTSEQFDKIVKAGAELENSKKLAASCIELVDLYEKKDSAVKELVGEVESLKNSFQAIKEANEIYRDANKALLDSYKTSLFSKPRFGLYAGVGMTQEDQGLWRQEYEFGVTFSFGN